MKHFSALIIGGAMLLIAAGPSTAAEPLVSAQPSVFYGGSMAKASVDTVTLMGPYGNYPYRGDFETANARPGGDGLLPDGWTSEDGLRPANYWHVDTYRNPFHGSAAWCGSLAYSSCGGSDPVGGYGNNWHDILEFRKTVGAGPVVARVRASVEYDCEPGYDYLTLQRRTAAAPEFEPVAGGQGLSWDGIGVVSVDYTFSWSAVELVGGTDVAFAFIFDSDGGWSDGDCSYASDGAARVDDLTVTLNGIDYTEDFEDGVVGPDWRVVPNPGPGDFSRIWDHLEDKDVCATNYSKVLAFLDDGLVVPGTGGSVGVPGYDYATSEGWIINHMGGLWGPASWHSVELYNVVMSPVMTLPGGGPSGVTLSFDVYTHNLLEIHGDNALYVWSVRSAAGGDIEQAPWVDRNFTYYGGPAYRRETKVVDDLLVPGATQVQIALGAFDYNLYCDFSCSGFDSFGSPAPWFDNVNVKAYPSTGPRIVVTEIRLANDGFPASGALDLANLGANSVRFDMATNISARSHLRNDPGDSIWVDITPRSGGTLATPVMHWTLAVKNPLFTDAHRTALAPGQTGGSVTGRVTRTATGAVVANRFNFDLPDTGMLFPGDVLHYYFAATDVVAGDARTATAPPDVSGFGNPAPMAYPGAYTVNCLPSVSHAQGTQPTLLFWNDFGFRGGEDEWYGALTSLGAQKGVDFDVFNTHGPTSGVGNGLGGRATVAQMAGYTDLLYSCGDLGSPTLSIGDYSWDAGNDLALLNGWIALGGRDLLLSGDDLANSLYASGTTARAFLETTMGVAYGDPDVRDDIDGQVSPLVVKVADNPVFTTSASWVTYGGCPVPNDFDRITPMGDAVRLAQFTASDGASTPYTAAAAVLNVSGTTRLVTLDHDLSFIVDEAKSSTLKKSPAPMPARALLLSNVLDYFQVALNPIEPADVPGATAALAVRCSPNPFNPTLTLRYTVPRPGRVTMKVFDARGALVRTLLDGPVQQTTGLVVWDGADQRGEDVSSGLYFVETRADGQVDVRKVTMLK